MHTRPNTATRAFLAILVLAPLLARAEPPVPSDAEIDTALSGLNLEGVGPAERKLLLSYAKGEYCYCGCPHTVASCLVHHGACKHSQRMVWLAAGFATHAGADVEAIKAFVAHYYASFDHRAKPDLKAYGPPLGDEKAPVTLVEYSDFTCPFCQGFRPVLEAFVAAHPGRVKLYFKPFPIESHIGALDAALAAEWARDLGAFWKIHDDFFSLPSHDLDSLAAAADNEKLDASDLRDAVTSRRFLKRVRASQDEGRVVGVRGTPTLFMNGRHLQLPDNTASWLEFALEDEEESIENSGRWAKD